MTLFPLRSLALSLIALSLLAGGVALPVRAANTFSSGSTGADGAFAPTSNVTLQVPPSGVFNFTTVTIPNGVTVTFTPNTANTPVTILATGNVTVNGTIDVSGGAGGITINIGNGTSHLDGTARSTGGPGGPGGFSGGGGGAGATYTGVSGDGPGGGGGSGNASISYGAGGGGSYATSGGTGTDNYYGNTVNGAGGSIYGSSLLVPLIGGSGGGGGASSYTIKGGSGGGGGGAILIASSGTINVTNGLIAARGGIGGVYSGSFGVGTGGGGAGGAIRLVATAITGTVSVDLNGGSGGNYSGSLVGGQGGAGYARLEAYNFTGASINEVGGVGIVSTGTPGSISSASVPQLQIVSVAGVNAPASPVGSLSAPPDILVQNTVANPVTVALSAQNIPTGTIVTVSLTPQAGTETTVQSTALAGTSVSSTASASVSLPTGKCLIYASATITLTGTSMAQRLKMDGEPVDKILVAATFGEPSQVTYILHSGRKIVLGASSAAQPELGFP